jgi:hypothetical protein
MSPIRLEAAPLAPGGVLTGTEGGRIARQFLDALAARDFDAMTTLLADDVWLRALLPRHVAEHHGSKATGGAFRSWFAGAEAFEVVAVGHDTIAGKERIAYRLVLRPNWRPETWHVIEQMAYLSIRSGRVRKIDLVCTGFAPLDEPPGVP